MSLRDFFGTIRAEMRTLSVFCSGLTLGGAMAQKPKSLRSKGKMVGAAGFEPTTP